MIVKLPRVSVACGLYSNWDSVVQVDEKILSWIKMSKKSKPAKPVLQTKQEVFYTLQKALEEGGYEALISEKIFRWLDSKLKPRKKQLGGNGNNMGRVLLELGLKPLVAYPCRPEKLMLASPNFKVVSRAKLVPPSKAIRSKDPEYEHLVFEFEKGRHILSWDRMSSEGIFDLEWLEFASKPRLTKIVLLGFAHLLLPAFKERVKLVIDYFDKKQRPRIHLECGSGSEKSMKYAIEKFADSSCLDSLGLNEQECKQYFGCKTKSLENLKQSALEAACKYGIQRICVHTREFVLSVSRLDPRKEVEALKEACLVAAAKTFGNLNFEKARKLSCKGKIKKEKIDGYNFCFVPTLVNPKPKSTLGLGDCFTAVQATKALAGYRK